VFFVKPIALRELELAKAMGPVPVSAPDAPERTGADVSRHGLGGAGPMRAHGRLLFRRPRDDAFGVREMEFRDVRAQRVIRQKALETFDRKSLLPQHQLLVLALPVSRDRDSADALGRRKHDLRAPDMLPRRVVVS
jgi:hypothetical protein